MAEQAVEKALKAVLLSLGLQLRDEELKRFGRDLSRLQNLMPAALQLPVDTTIANRLTRLTTRGRDSRYPSVDQKAGLVAPVDRFQSSSQDLDDANVLVKWCRERVRRAQKGVAAMKP